MRCLQMKGGKLHHRTPDRTGQRYGKLTFLHPTVSDGKKRKWTLRCDCGMEVERVATDVVKAARRGLIPQCRDCTAASASARKKTHGMSKHPAFAVWRSMIDRCRLPSHQ